MADVITRFKLETTQYDSKLRDAAKGLNEFIRVAENGGKGFTEFSQKSIQAAKDLGTVASGATNLKDKVKDLVGAYNDAAKAYNKLSQEQQQSDFGKALAESIGQLSSRIKDAKEELYGLGDALDQVKGKGGLFGEGGLTGMLQVAGGNLLAQGITKLGSEMAETIQQGIELARQGEGIRIAFERLNRPGLLDNLKEATHGTVSEIELMKAAVKFDDFKLPVEQLGTMLEFAQKKAKDTGQSVDYMVDSIVTGLGRKSLMILDNLGLSAAQIKDKMKETGDMTTAVAAIIKEQMGEAGEYVETAADRAARAAADATNEMERLGREAQPFAEEWAKAWNEIKIGGMQVLTTVFGPLAESARQIRRILSGEFNFKEGIPNLAEGSTGSPFGGKKPTWGDVPVVTAPGGYVEVTDRYTGAVIGGQHFDNLSDINAIKDWQKTLFKTPKTPKGSKTLTDPEKAQAKFDQAQKDYQQALSQAAMEMKAGTITEADAKKKELQARENLWKSIGDAREIYDSPKLEEAQRNVENEIIYFGGVVKSAADQQEAAKKSAKELEAAQKKLTDAETERATALQQNDLKAFYAANKKVVGAGGEATNDIGFTYTKNNLDAFIANLKQRISEADVGSELLDSLNDQMADAQTLGNIMETALKNGIDAAQFDPQELFRKIFGDGKTAGDYIKNEVWQNILNSMGQKSGKRFSLDTRSGAVSTGKDGKGGMEQFASDFSKVTGSISSIASGIQNLGVEIPEGLAKTIGAIQTISGILTAILTITTLIQATQTANTGTNILSTFAKIGLMAVGMNRGGIVPHAANGYFVPGNHYSSDMTPIMADAGELILNRAAQGNIASQLEGGGLQNLNLSAIITGEQIRLVLNNNGRRTGRGEYVTTNFTRG